jgi:hypothetical protein
MTDVTSKARKLRSMVRELTSQHLKVTVRELQETGGEKIASALQQV